MPGRKPTTCHRCPVSKEIEQGLHKRTPWQAMPCSTCRFRDTDEQGRDNGSKRGRTRLTLDVFDGLEAVEAEQAMQERTEGRKYELPSWLEGINEEARETAQDALASVLREFAELDMVTLDIILSMTARGLSLEGASARHGFTKQAAHARIRRAEETHQWVARLGLTQKRQDIK